MKERLSLVSIREDPNKWLSSKFRKIWQNFLKVFLDTLCQSTLPLSLNSAVNKLKIVEVVKRKLMMSFCPC